MTQDQILFAVLAGILLLTTIEMVVAFLSHREWNYKDSAASLGVYAIGVVLDRLLSTALSLLILNQVAKLAVFSIPATALSMAFLIFGMDFIYYWKHRFEHEIRGFWAHHSVHHNSNHFNLSTALRVGWLGPLYGWIFFVPMTLLGYEPALVIFAYKLILLYQFWVHSEKIPKLGWLENLLNTPSNHRVHHGSDFKYLDKNYGGILILWDKLFSTYQAEEETPTYGLVKPVELYNPFSLVFYEPIQLTKDILKQAKYSDKLKMIYKAPGWAPGAEAIHPEPAAEAKVKKEKKVKKVS